MMYGHGVGLMYGQKCRVGGNERDRKYTHRMPVSTASQKRPDAMFD